MVPIDGACRKDLTTRRAIAVLFALTLILGALTAGGLVPKLSGGIYAVLYAVAYLAWPAVRLGILTIPIIGDAVAAIERQGSTSARQARPDNGNGIALVLAAKVGDVDALRVLLDAGADVNSHARTNDGEITALIQAASEGRAAAVAYLIERGADLSDQGDTGLTPLMVAVGAGSMETVQLLLAKGAPVNAKARGGVTALALAYNMAAKSQGYGPVIEALKAAGAEKNFWH